MKRILIVGGANGIGLSIAMEMINRADCERVYVIDKESLASEYSHPKICSFIFDLKSDDFSFFDKFHDVDSVMITAGFGKLSLFQDVSEDSITDYFLVNSIAPIKIIHRFMSRLSGNDDFYCGVMVSIAGFMSSPFYSVYGATKAALKVFIESVNVELEKGGTSNRILNVSPGAIQGTCFNGGVNDVSQTRLLSNQIIEHLYKKDDLYIPKYDEVYKEVLTRYYADFREEGRHSYDYKLKSGRIK